MMRKGKAGLLYGTSIIFFIPTSVGYLGAS
jgi:hypothetical protein